jgi:hypothetical protein
MMTVKEHADFFARFIGKYPHRVQEIMELSVQLSKVLEACKRFEKASDDFVYLHDKFWSDGKDKK